MLLVEARDHVPSVDLEALRHQRAQRIRREAVHAFGDVERRKPEIRHIRQDRRGHEEPPGLQEAEAMPVAGGEQTARDRDHAPAAPSPRWRAHRGDARRGTRGTRARPRRERPPSRRQRLARPLGIALRHQRQIEQPFARIVDDPEGDRGGAAGDAGQQPARGVRRHELHLIPISLMSSVRAGQSGEPAAIASILRS